MLGTPTLRVLSALRKTRMLLTHQPPAIATVSNGLGCHCTSWQVLSGTAGLTAVSPACRD